MRESQVIRSGNTSIEVVTPDLTSKHFLALEAELHKFLVTCFKKNNGTLFHRWSEVYSTSHRWSGETEKTRLELWTEDQETYRIVIISKVFPELGIEGKDKLGGILTMSKQALAIVKKKYDDLVALEELKQEVLSR